MFFTELTLTENEDFDEKIKWTQNNIELVEIDQDKAHTYFSQGWTVYFLTEYNSINYSSWWQEHETFFYGKDNQKITKTQVHYLPVSAQYFFDKKSLARLSK